MGVVHIHFYRKPDQSVINLHKFHYKNVATLFKFNESEIKQIFLHFIKKGQVHYFKNEEGYSEVSSSITQTLKKISYKHHVSEKEYRQMFEDIDYMLEEEMDNLHYICLNKETSFGKIEMQLYQPSLLVKDRYMYPRMDTIKDEKTVLNKALGLYVEIFGLMNKFKDVTINPISLKEEKLLEHPLSNAHSVLDMIFTGADKEKILDIVSLEEWEEIRKHILNSVKDYEGKKIYQKEYERWRR